MSHWITTGNEVDISIAECIDVLVDRVEVNTLVIYAEGINDPRGLQRSLIKARAAHKPVIFLKVGRTEAGAEAAESHTASLAVSDSVCDAFFKQHGVFRANTTEDMIDMAYACQMGLFPRGRNLGIITASGGVGVQMADCAIKHGLEIPILPNEVQDKVRKILPYAAVRNPVDVTAMAIDNPAYYLTPVFDAVLSSEDINSVGIFFTPDQGTHEFTDLILKTLERMRKCQSPKVISINIILPDDVRARYEDLGHTVFDTPDKAVASLAILANFRESFERGEGARPPRLPLDIQPIPTYAINEVQSKNILRSAGISVVREKLVTNAVAAVDAAIDIGLPVVMKISSADIQHKTEIGGVLIGVETTADVHEGFGALMLRAEGNMPQAKLDGVIVSEMISDGVETVIGSSIDPTFGPVVMFGLGGIFVEVIQDITFRIAPFGIDEAESMIREIQSFEVLMGARGGVAVDLVSLASTLSQVSVFASENADDMLSLDINPFMALPNGGVALDALIVAKD